MFDPHLIVTATLRTQTPMHIGSGQSLASPDKQSHEVSSVLKGVDGPFIPGATVKGALRARLPEGLANTLFGRRLDGNQGQVAEMWIDASPFTHASSVSTGGLWDKERVSAHRHDAIFWSKHTAINPKTGAADPNKLYEREMIAPRTEFGFTAHYFGSETQDLLKALEVLARGIQLGKEKTKGNGSIYLDPDTLKIEKSYIEPAGGLKVVEDISAEHNAKQLVEALRNARNIGDLPPDDTRVFRAVCDGPFISMRKVETNPSTVRPLEFDGKPFLWTKSLAGALRARAGWLLECERAQADFEAAEEQTLIDDREQILEAGEKPLEKLQPIQRLFGVTGYCAQLQIISLEAENGSQRQPSVTSVSIDRITGGGREKFLFTEDVFWGAVFRFALRLDHRADEKTEELFSKLLDDITSNGLQLGHGASKGFGWFDDIQEVASE